MDTSDLNENPQSYLQHNQPIIVFEQHLNDPLYNQDEKGNEIKEDQELLELKIIIDKKFSEEQQYLEKQLNSILKYKKNILYEIEDVIQIPLEQLQQKQNENFTGNVKQLQKDFDQLQKEINAIIKYKQEIINGIEKNIEFLVDQLKNIKSSKQKFQEQESSNDHDRFNKLDQLKNYLKYQEGNHKQVNLIIKLQLFDLLQNQLSFDHLDQNKVYSQKIQNLSNLQYGLIGQSDKKQIPHCCALTLNKDNTILIVGCKSEIKIFQFINGIIGEELQVLTNHQIWIQHLTLMKLSNCLVSGSQDKSLIIWKYDEINMWNIQQIITDHLDTVNCIFINKNEDFLLSGSDDKNIKFWMQENNQWYCKQTIRTDNYELAMSFNEMENKITSCGTDDNIYVLDIQSEQLWYIKQKIDVSEYGFRICFTQKDQFIFQPQTQGFLEIYDYENSTNSYKIFQKLNILRLMEFIITTEMQ